MHGKKLRSSTSRGSIHSGHSTCSSPDWFSTDIFKNFAYKARTNFKTPAKVTLLSVTDSCGVKQRISSTGDTYQVYQLLFYEIGNSCHCQKVVRRWRIRFLGGFHLNFYDFQPKLFPNTRTGLFITVLVRFPYALQIF